MGSIEPGSEEKSHENRLEGPPATENKPPNEQKHAEEREQAPKKPRGPAWRRALGLRSILRGPACSCMRRGGGYSPGMHPKGQNPIGPWMIRSGRMIDYA